MRPKTKERKFGANLCATPVGIDHAIKRSGVKIPEAHVRGHQKRIAAGGPAVWYDIAGSQTPSQGIELGWATHDATDSDSPVRKLHARNLHN